MTHPTTPKPLSPSIPLTDVSSGPRCLYISTVIEYRRPHRTPTHEPDYQVAFPFEMRFSSVAACLSAALVPAAALSVFNGRAPDVVPNEDLKIPGESPLELCPGEHDKDLIEIKSVDLLPNPPQAYVASRPIIVTNTKRAANPFTVVRNWSSRRRGRSRRRSRKGHMFC